jgi:hypothetical protein
MDQGELVRQKSGVAKKYSMNEAIGKEWGELPSG